MNKLQEKTQIFQKDHRKEATQIGHFYDRVVVSQAIRVGLTAVVIAGAYTLNTPILGVIGIGVIARSVISRVLLNLVIDAYAKKYLSIDTTKAIIRFLLTITSVADRDRDGNTAIDKFLCSIKGKIDKHNEIWDFLIRQHDGEKALLSRDSYNLLPAHYLSEKQLEDCEKLIGNIQILDKKYIQEGCQKFSAFKKEFNKKNQDKIITAKSFDEVVKGFKLSFNLKSLRKALSTGDTKLSQKHKDRLLEIFFADSAISEYLSRSGVKSKDFELILDSKYEHSLYKRRPQYDIHIPFRESGIRGHEPCKNFYFSGSQPKSNRINFLLEKLKIKNSLNNNIHFAPNNHIFMDIYKVGDKTEEIEVTQEALNQKANFSYYVFPGTKDQHAYLTAAIFDAKTGQSICTLLINSWQKQTYFHYLKERFEMNNATCPFIDCSINVQVNEKDENCALYSSIFGRALVQLLNDQSESADKIFEAYQNASPELKSQAEEKIQTFIRYNIVKYLPEYFEKDKNDVYQRKSMEGLRDFHMQRRWEIGNVAIKEMSQKAEEKIQENDLI